MFKGKNYLLAIKQTQTWDSITISYNFPSTDNRRRIPREKIPCVYIIEKTHLNTIPSSIKQYFPPKFFLSISQTPKFYAS